MEVIIIDSKAFKKLKEDLFEEFKQVLIEAKKETLAQLAMESDWVNTAEAKRGCCSNHGGANHCDRKTYRIVCNDGTYSNSCLCEQHSKNKKFRY